VYQKRRKLPIKWGLRKPIVWFCSLNGQAMLSFRITPVTSIIRLDDVALTGGRGMRSFIQRIQQYRRDVKLFLLFTLAANVGIGMFMLIFNLYLLELDLREDYIGAFNAVHTVGIAAMSLTMGMLINRLGVWRCVTIGFVFFLLSSVLLVTVTHPELLLGLAILGGVGTAFLFVPTMPFIVDLTRTSERQGVAALSFSLSSLSLTVASLVGGFTPRGLAAILPVEAPSAAAFRYTLLLGLGIAALALIPLFRMSEQLRNARPDDAAQETQTGLPPLPPGRVRQHMLVFIAVGGLMSLGAGMVFPFYNVYLSSIGAGAGQIGLIFSVAGIAAAILGLGSPYLASRFGAQTAVVMVRLAPLPLFAIMIFFPVLSIAVLAHVIRTASINMGWPIDSSYIAGVLPARARTAVFGYRSGAWSIGYALAALVGGNVIVRFGYGVTFAGYVLFMLVAMGLFFTYFSRYSPTRAVASQVPAQPLVDRVPHVLSREPDSDVGTTPATGP
jgi:MFS family permease